MACMPSIWIRQYSVQGSVPGDPFMVILQDGYGGTCWLEGPCNGCTLCTHDPKETGSTVHMLNDSHALHVRLQAHLFYFAVCHVSTTAEAVPVVAGLTVKLPQPGQLGPGLCRLIGQVATTMVVHKSVCVCVCVWAWNGCQPSGHSRPVAVTSDSSRSKST